MWHACGQPCPLNGTALRLKTLIRWSVFFLLCGMRASVLQGLLATRNRSPAVSVVWTASRCRLSCMHMSTVPTDRYACACLLDSPISCYTQGIVLCMAQYSSRRHGRVCTMHGKSAGMQRCIQTLVLHHTPNCMVPHALPLSRHGSTHASSYGICFVRMTARMRTCACGTTYYACL